MIQAAARRRDESRARPGEGLDETSRALLAVEAAVLLLLKKAVQEVIRDALVNGLPPHFAAASMAQALQRAIVEARRLARRAGRARLRQEAARFRRELSAELRAGTANLDLARAQFLAQRQARRWLKAVQDAEAAALVRRTLADEEELEQPAEDRRTAIWLVAVAAVAKALDRIGISESAQAFSDERTRAAREFGDVFDGIELKKRWNAVLDAKTCPVCRGLHGTIIPIDEPFTSGEPGAIHPHCRCTWELVL